MEITDRIFSLYYAFSYSAIISFARVFTDRSKSAFYEKSRKTIIHKWKYILSGRSHCDHCNKTISPVFLMPVIGYLLTFGRCSKCHHKISIIYFVEESTAFLYGLLYFSILHANNNHYHASTIIMAFYLFICYFISRIDIKYYLIATEAILSFFLIAFLEFYFISSTPEILLVISIPVTWFALLHFLNYIMPGKLGLADIHLIPVLCFAIGFPHSMYLPTVAAFTAIIYFFIRYRKEEWNSARKKKIPFGFFLSISFLLLKLVPFSFRPI